MHWRKIPIEDHYLKLRQHLPLDTQFIAIWKGVMCLCEYDENEDRFYIGMLPSTGMGFFRLDKDRECKFTYVLDVILPKEI